MVKILFLCLIFGCLILPNDLFSQRKKRQKSKSESVDTMGLILNGLQLGPEKLVEPEPIKPVIPEQPTIIFEKDTFDFGNVAQGDSVVFVFSYKNGGKGQLKLQSVKPSCGCTVPHWSDKLLDYNQSGEISVVFNTAGKLGKQTKEIFVQSNSLTPLKVLCIKGNVNALGGLKLMPVGKSH